MEYWSKPTLVGPREWELTNISGRELTVEGIRSFDGVSLPFLVVLDGLHQTVANGKSITVRFRGTSIRNSFSGLVLTGVDGEGCQWVSHYPTLHP